MLFTEYENQRCTRRCAATGRELAPGEPFYAVLLAEGDSFQRRDYSQEAWTGPPEGPVVGWWQSRMPSAEPRKARLAPNEVLLELFHQLQQPPPRPAMLYVVALLLLRRRVFRHEETVQEPPHGEVMVLYCPRSETTYRVACVEPQSEEVAAIQEHLAQLLFAEPE